jgi:hypothetical protein
VETEEVLYLGRHLQEVVVEFSVSLLVIHPTEKIEKDCETERRMWQKKRLRKRDKKSVCLSLSDEIKPQDVGFCEVVHVSVFQQNWEVKRVREWVVLVVKGMVLLVWMDQSVLPK